jgi:ABC-type transport system involved in multi-copper enzyme maturation permease subunit
VWFQRTFCQPVVLLSFFRRWMRHKLERNPIGWLEQRTWSGRLVTWGWFAVIISLYSAIFTDKNFFRGYGEMQRVVACLLTGCLAMCAAGSFRRERETAVLELLLVSPLSENQIISGRLEGLWGQFLPAFGLLLAIWAYFSTWLGNMLDDAQAISFYAFSFLSLPVIGLYFSLCCRNFLSAFLSTIGVGFLLPLALPLLLRFLAFERYMPATIQTSVPASLLQSLFAIICWFQLHDRLKRRAFPFDRRES